MKKILTSLFFAMILSIPAYSQVVKLEQVFGDRVSQTYLSFHKHLEGDTTENPVFSLWGFQRYDESWIIAYEVEYFKGSATEMFHFLNEVVAFAEKYQNESGILTVISEVKVKTAYQTSPRYTQVFDPDGKVCCQFRYREWNRILDDFKMFCEKNAIQYRN